MIYDFILIDADDTLFDFAKCEKQALREAFSQAAIPFDEQVYRDYSEINLSLWKQLERNEISREALKTRRFEMLGRRHPLGCSPEALNGFYAQALSEQTFLIDGAKAFLEQAARAARLYIVTNGIASTQQRRFAAAGILPYISGVFISEQIGAPKPEKAFFDAVFAAIPGFDKKRAVIIGDSLTSDMAGGAAAGIDTCWFNPAGAPLTEKVRPTYEIQSLSEAIKRMGETQNVHQEH